MTYTLLANGCRLVLSLVLMLSGFVKAVDPVGFMYKLQEYEAGVGLDIFSDDWLLFISIMQAAVEFLLGVFMFMGVYRRFVAWLTFLVLAFFAVFTMYVLIESPVNDCGCFGDAFALTNEATFVKNLVLLALSSVVLLGRRRYVCCVSSKNRWMVVVFSFFYIAVVEGMSLSTLPVLDFRPYAVGNDLRDMVNGVPSAYEVKLVYEKNGEECEFMQDSLPDSSWNFVENRSELVSEGEAPLISDFSIIDWDADYDIASQVLSDTGYVYILVMEYVESASVARVDKINDLYDYCVEKSIPFYATTASVEDEVALWRKRTGAEYPIYWSDNMMLRAMVRSNPGVVLLKDGVVAGKWNVADMPDIESLAHSTEGVLNKQLGLSERMRSWGFWIILLFVPLLLISLFDLATAPWREKKKNQGNKATGKDGETDNEVIQNNINLKNFIDMRKNIVAGNWKMNMNLQEGIALAKELNEALTADKPNCDVVICTPFIHLASVTPIVDEAIIGVGAENCADKVSGAYTGEVSASMVASTGAKYVILGHSERRAYYGETPEILKEKVQLALANGLTPIFCIGEVLEERNQGIQNKVVFEQLAGSLYALSAADFSKIILAYEPVWAIGTGLTATPEQAEEIHAYIRSTIAEKYGNEVAENTSILYGGSCKPSNAKELFANPTVDGGLIGGAALKVADFKGIIDAFK